MKKKPTYYRKSKAAKEMQLKEVYSVSDDSYMEPFIDRRKEKNQRPKSVQRGKHHRKYEYSEYENQFNDNTKYNTNRGYKFNRQYNGGRHNNYDGQYNDGGQYNLEMQYNDESQIMNYDINYPYHYINQNPHNAGYDISEYFTEDGQDPHHHYPYTVTETSIIESDDSDCQMCSNHRRRRSRTRTDNNTEYTTDYSYQEQRTRHKPVHIRRPNTTNHRNPYKKDYNIYVAHNPFTHKQQQLQMQQSTESSSESEEVAEKENFGFFREKLPAHHVYTAQMDQNTAAVFDQQKEDDNMEKHNQREKIMPTASYNGNIPILALKKNTSNVTLGQDDTGVVYLPVLVLDKSIKLPKCRIMSPETLMNNTREQAEKPLETHMQVYAAADIEQGNIFQQAQKGETTQNQAEFNGTREVPQKDLKFPLNQNIKVYTANEQKSQTMMKTQSTASMASGSKGIHSQANYPVQKSYINVAPSKIQSGQDLSVSPLDKKASKISVRSVLSRIGMSRSSGREGTISKGYKKEITLRKDKAHEKTGHERGGSVVLSIVNPLPNDEIYVQARKPASIASRTNTAIGTIKPSQSNIFKQRKSNTNLPRVERGTTEKRGTLSPNNRQNKTGDRISGLYQHKSVLEKIGTELGAKKSALDVYRKEFTKERGKHKGEQRFLRKSEPTVLPVQASESIVMTPEKKSITAQLLHRKNKEPQSEQSSSRELLSKSNSKTNLQDIPANYDPYTFMKVDSPQQILTSNKNEPRARNLKGSQSLIRKTPPAKKKNVDPHRRRIRKKQENRPVQMWGYDITPLMYVYHTAQLILGISIHNQLMEVLMTFTEPDHV